jgi:hypothetical protein
VLIRVLRLLQTLTLILLRPLVLLRVLMRPLALMTLPMMVPMMVPRRRARSSPSNWP